MPNRTHVIFVHGLSPSTDAWRSFTQLITTDPELADRVGVRCFGYDSPRVRLRPDRRIAEIDDIADRLATWLRTHCADGAPIVLVSHSQGGLVVQRFLARTLWRGQGRQLAHIKRVVMYTCPNNGSNFFLRLRESVRTWNHPQERELRPLRSRALLEAQRTVLEKVVGARATSDTECPIPISAFGGQTDRMVPPATATNPFTGGVIEGDHFSIVKPAYRSAESYCVLKDVLLEVIAAHTPPEPPHLPELGPPSLPPAPPTAGAARGAPGGNPAGVVLDATGVDDATMLATAAEVGYSETAFVMPSDDGTLGVRYFSPLAEVPFCGHATIATAVAYAQRHGTGLLRLRTKAGPVPVTTSLAADGSVVASLVSVQPRSAPIAEADLAELLAALRWPPEDLDPALPPRAAYAGAWHPVVAAASRRRLAELDYDMPSLTALMRRRDWATVDLVWRESETVFHARNPFPPGGVVEDPATGAAAAALGGYLRELQLVPVPATLTIHQGADMGRPSTITVSVPQEPGSGIEVTGTAVRI